MSTIQTITSSAKILVNPVVLKLFQTADLINELGTISNPVIFTGAIAGNITLLPVNPLLLYNDKDGTFQSVDAKNITVEVLSMQLVDELVGTSTGLANQSYTVAYSPILNQTNAFVSVRVGTDIWTEVSSFFGVSNTANVFVVNYTTGAISFGNNVNGAIPTLGQSIYVTYSPNTTTYGKEAMSDGWLGVQSVGVDAHSRNILLDTATILDINHIQVTHTPLIGSSAVSGIYLANDPNRLGINYFTGGSYNAVTGVITVGTSLPLGSGIVLVDYAYTVTSDAEVGFTQLSTGVAHTFTYPIPSTCAKTLNFQVVIPSGASPTNGVNVQFRLRLTYTEF